MAKSYNNSSYYDYLQYISLPIHLFFFLAIIFIFLGFTWYINFESIFQEFRNNLKLILIISPVLLLLVHWLSHDDQEGGSSVVSMPEKEWIHKSGGSPWGVAILLVFLLFMISYRSSWFLFQTRR